MFAFWYLCINTLRWDSFIADCPDKFKRSFHSNIIWSFEKKKDYPTDFWDRALQFGRTNFPFKRGPICNFLLPFLNTHFIYMSRVFASSEVTTHTTASYAQLQLQNLYLQCCGSAYSAYFLLYPIHVCLGTNFIISLACKKFLPRGFLGVSKVFLFFANCCTWIRL